MVRSNALIPVGEYQMPEVPFGSAWGAMGPRIGISSATRLLSSGNSLAAAVSRYNGCSPASVFGFCARTAGWTIFVPQM
jgi:hypothetical protein